MEASITLEQNYVSQDEKKFINFLNERRIKNGKASHTGVGKQTGMFLIEGYRVLQYVHILEHLIYY